MIDTFYIAQTEDAKDLPLPHFATAGSAGCDVYANVQNELILEPGKVALVPTGIKIAIPQGFEAQMRPRSGLALKHGITLLNSPGTIDSDYRGEIKVILINFSDAPFRVTRGDRIAQMVLAEVVQASFIRLEEGQLDTLETERGSGGFGHTGV